jgi:hypothetical protein
MNPSVLSLDTLLEYMPSLFTCSMTYIDRISDFLASLATVNVQLFSPEHQSWQPSVLLAGLRSLDPHSWPDRITVINTSRHHYSSTSVLQGSWIRTSPITRLSCFNHALSDRFLFSVVLWLCRRTWSPHCNLNVPYA